MLVHTAFVLAACLAVLNASACAGEVTLNAQGSFFPEDVGYAVVLMQRSQKMSQISPPIVPFGVSNSSALKQGEQKPGDVDDDGGELFGADDVSAENGSQKDFESLKEKVELLKKEREELKRKREELRRKRAAKVMIKEKGDVEEKQEEDIEEVAKVMIKEHEAHDALDLLRKAQRRLLYCLAQSDDIKKDIESALKLFAEGIEGLEEEFENDSFVKRLVNARMALGAWQEGNQTDAKGEEKIQDAVREINTAVHHFDVFDAADAPDAPDATQKQQVVADAPDAPDATGPPGDSFAASAESGMDDNKAVQNEMGTADSEESGDNEAVEAKLHKAEQLLLQALLDLGGARIHWSWQDDLEKVREDIMAGLFLARGAHDTLAAHLDGKHNRTSLTELLHALENVQQGVEDFADPSRSSGALEEEIQSAIRSINKIGKIFKQTSAEFDEKSKERLAKVHDKLEAAQKRSAETMERVVDLKARIVSRIPSLQQESREDVQEAQNKISEKDDAKEYDALANDVAKKKAGHMEELQETNGQQ